MNTRAHLIGLVVGCGLLLALFVLLAASPAQSAWPAPTAERPSIGDVVIRATTEITVLTVNISNEPPGYLIDHLYDQLGGDVPNANFFEALGYLKDHSNGVITEEFYHAVDTAPGSEEVHLTLLRDYRRPFTGSVEIAEDGTVHTRNLPGNATYPGFATVPGTDGQFNLTYAQDPADYIHTGTTSYAGMEYHYKAFAIAWRDEHALFMPLVVR
ncbi:MAG TPA: hypothetical protein GYA08_12370 [Chloroflexi bacterium]|nr:hypothetical protein [Chloroflexota bacterium]